MQAGHDKTRKKTRWLLSWVRSCPRLILKILSCRSSQSRTLEHDRFGDGVFTEVIKGSRDYLGGRPQSYTAGTLTKEGNVDKDTDDAGTMRSKAVICKPAPQEKPGLLTP